MKSLRDTNIFRLNPLITNFQCKLATITEYDPKKQILCLVSEDNEILFRYTHESGAVVLKVVSWFQKSSRVIHDVCFDPTGSWLLVLCFDNTLHVVPALKIVDDTESISNNNFNVSEITSFVIPFVGPHECPSSKTCPNNDLSTSPSSSPACLSEYAVERSNMITNNESLELHLSKAEITEIPGTPYETLNNPGGASSPEICSRKSSKNDGTCTLSRSNESSSTNSRESTESFLSSSTCPFPMSAAWWQTLDKRNRAVIGYSDGSICFVGLSPNCPFIANTLIETGGVLKLFVCRDNSMENVTLLINSTLKQQWKLLLEQKCINYTFPGDVSPSVGNSQDSTRGDWQFVMPVKSTDSLQSDDKATISEEQAPSAPLDILEATSSLTLDEKTHENDEISNRTGLLPAAKARLTFLKTLGTKKFNALKMKMSEQKSRMDEYSRNTDAGTFAIVDTPTTAPEILTTPSGPYFVVQNLRNTYLLSALHNYSDTLSVHSMDISLIPLFLYKIPTHCQEVLIGSNLLYSIRLLPRESSSKDGETVDEKTARDEDGENNNDKSSVKDEEKHLNAVSVISNAMASMKNGEDIDFNVKSLLGTFFFPEETVINVFRMLKFPPPEKPLPKEESNDTLPSGAVNSPSAYVRLQKLDIEQNYTSNDIEFMQNSFPKINYDPCIVVTSKNTYYIDLHSAPYELFLNAALSSSWAACEEFSTTFDLQFEQCIEFAGDYLLRKKKVTQALLTYNIARIPPVRTALKLAMFKENNALMHLCAMALRCVFILNSKYFLKPIIKLLLENGSFRHTEAVQQLAPPKPNVNEDINEGRSCSDYNYSADKNLAVQYMSASSQFHLSNLLLITLAERSVKEKNYVPLWNFLVSNSKFHTNMTSIVLCQSGLYSSALLLALVRGACIDVFVGLVSVSNQEFGWYSELNVLLYNLSDVIFVECLTYLRHISTDYFNVILGNIISGKLETNVLERLEKQFNPFAPAVRPIVLNLPSKGFCHTEESNADQNNFCKTFIETYLGVILQLEIVRRKPDNLLNALATFKLTQEDNQFAIDSNNFPPISVGCSHSCCVIDGCAYFWGSSSVPCVYSVTKTSDPAEPPYVVKNLDIISQLNLEVHAVKCGRQHTLVLTNNGLYAFGSNQHGQLGIKSQMLCALQPMLVEAFDSKRITILEAGQYHNAAVVENQLFTWGWGVFGQLGHGDTESCLQPQQVLFFSKMNILQVSLGHAHSLVLCSSLNGSRELYVFGSNHFGQLGLGNRTLSEGKESYLVKSLFPIKLEVSEKPIRLIHTKFFSNLAVDENDTLYTWGASPQVLRLANQVKRRSTAKQKIEENLRKEINKRTETNKEAENTKHLNEKNMSRRKERKSVEDEELEYMYQYVKEVEMKVMSVEINQEETASTETENLDNLPAEGAPPIIVVTESEEPEVPVPEEVDTSTTRNSKKQDQIEPDATEHFFPQIVDTTEVSGKILQMSSGVFHYALISSTSLLYTWGKNLEFQLGTEDKDRKAINKPTPLENIENPLHVECGADFTVVISTDYVVKAFGGNSHGQCGQELTTTGDKSRIGKLHCLPTAKRLIRIDGQCIQVPTVVNLPRPRIQMDSEPTRYARSLPKFKPQLMQKCGMILEADNAQSLSSSGNVHDSDDVASSAENVSFNEDDSVASSLVCFQNLGFDMSPDEDSQVVYSDLVNSPHFRHYIHYCLYIFHGLYDSKKLLELARNCTEFQIRILMLNFKFVESFKICLHSCRNAQKSVKLFEFFTKDTSIVPIRKQDLKFFIYEIFIHFISHKFDLIECEKFFLSDLDYYLLELSFVLFFNNNNTEMEQKLNKKFKDLFAQSHTENQQHKMEDTDRIFDVLSVKFKTIVCQRLLQVNDDYN